MLRRRKTILSCVISLVLLYYSAAWAVLRCNHDYDHPSGEIEASERNRPAHGHAFVLGGNSAVIDCPDVDYHTEILAGPKAPPQIHRAVVTSSIHAEVLSGSGSRLERDGINPFARFNLGATRSELIHPPVYLFVSNLRI